jgi:NitT/TauT family transport system substrate-binding protein
MDARRRVGTLVFIFAALVSASDGMAQEKITVAYSSVEAPNANWYIAQDNLFYKKYGLDIELIYVPSSTTTVSALVGGSIRVGNISGGAIANAAVGGADVVAVGCFINTLPYELIVHESIRSPQQLKGKSVGISRLGRFVRRCRAGVDQGIEARSR